MTFLKDTVNFFRREPIWGWLLLFLVTVYGVSVLGPRPGPAEPEPPSEAIETLRMAEEKLKAQIQAAGSVQEFLTEKPGLALAFHLFTLALIVAVLAGLLLDFFWFSRWRREESFRVAGGSPAAWTWGIGTVFKTLLLFVCASLSLSVFMNLFRQFLLRETSPNIFILVHTTLSDLICLGLILYFIRPLGGHWKDLGFRGSRFWKDLGVGFTAYFAVLPAFFLVLVGLVILVQWLAYEPPPHPLVEVFLEEEKRAPLIVAYSIFLACAAGPFFEEVFFRGFCYPALKKRWGVGWGLVLSSAFFALIHENWFAFGPIFVLGLGLGYLYEKRGTLVPSIALHILHNSVFIAYFFMAKKVLLGA